MDLSHLIKRKRKLKDFSHSEKQSLLIWLRPLVWVHVGLITTACGFISLRAFFDSRNSKLANAIDGTL